MRLPDGVVRLDSLKGYSIEWVDQDGYLLSRRSTLFHASSLSPPFRPLARFPTSHSRTLAAHIRVLARLLRLGYHNVIRLSRDRLLCTFQKRIGLFTPSGFSDVSSLQLPCRFLPGGCAVDSDGAVFLGEYRSNVQRCPVALYRLPPGENRLEVVYQFPENSIRHIHGVFADPFERTLWCSTGDWGEECQILRSADQFKTIERVGGGDESWRAVSLQFRNDAIYYGSDSERSENHIYRIDRRTGFRSRLEKVDGPVYFSTQHQDIIVMGVAAEGCPSQPVNRASIWTISSRDQVSRILSVSKDFYPLAFMTGAFRFPLGPGNQEPDLLLNCCALRRLDDVPVCIKGEVLGLSGAQTASKLYRTPRTP